MHKKKAGKLQTGSTIPKQYWLAVQKKVTTRLWYAAGPYWHTFGGILRLCEQIRYGINKGTEALIVAYQLIFFINKLHIS